MISANLVTRSHSSSLFLPPTHPSWIAFPRVMASVFIFSLSKTYRFKCLQELRGLCKLEWMHCSKAQDQPHRAYLQMDPASMQPVRDQPTYSVPCPLPKWHLFLTKSLLPDFPPPPPGTPESTCKNYSMSLLYGLTGILTSFCPDPNDLVLPLFPPHGRNLQPETISNLSSQLPYLSE